MTVAPIDVSPPRRAARRVATRLAGAIGVSVTVLAASCPPVHLGDPVTVPVSDSTPPTTTLNVILPNESLIAITAATAPVSRTLKGSDDVDLEGIGMDKDGGIKFVEVGGSVTRTCESGSLGQKQDMTYLKLCEKCPDNAQPGGTASTQRFVGLTVHLRDLQHG